MTLDVAEGLVAEGHVVDLVVASDEGALRDTVDPRVRIVDLAAGRVTRAVPGLVRYLRRVEPQGLVSAMTHANLAALTARSIARRRRIPLAVVEHSCLSTRMNRLRNRSWTSLQWPIARRLYRLADRVVGVSAGVRDELVEHFDLPEDRVSVVHNPLPLERIFAAQAAPLDHPWLRPGAPPVILGVGRLVPVKGFDLLVEAFRLVRTSRPCRLVILGEGPERAALTAQVAAAGLTEDVALPGFVANPHAWFARAGAFGLSSVYEGFGVVIAEALAAGCPVASVDIVAGPREILCHGAFGALVPRTAAALANGLVQALEAGRAPERVAARRARARVFSVQAAVDGYLNALGLS